VLVKEGSWPGIQYPRIPGHEVAGTIDEGGAGHGGHDGTCLLCRRGDFRNCRNLKIPDLNYDGGYQQYMVAPVEALAAIPEGPSDVQEAPLLCARITTFNALRHSGAMPGDLVAVGGISGLGHLGIQFANKFGYKARGDRARVRKRGARKEARSECVHRQQVDERSRGIAQTGRGTGNSGDGPKAQKRCRS
jgi:D-arabinose 1-dehydrogenase-like Zn-dependent alcohol dehydrogenase